MAKGKLSNYLELLELHMEVVASGGVKVSTRGQTFWTWGRERMVRLRSGSANS